MSPLSILDRARPKPARQPQPLLPSAAWTGAMPDGPLAAMRITEAYAAAVGRDAYFWAWPIVNMYNRRLHFAKVPEVMVAGAAPLAPINRLGMLTDYFGPEVRVLPCPNPDVVCGGGILALDRSPVVLQVPNFGNRFWLYQVLDTRTDSFASLGTMYGTTPGFYLLAGPAWQGDVPRGVTKVFHASASSGIVVPRVYQDDTREDKRAIQPALQQIMMYPLAEYDGQMKSVDWTQVPRMPLPTIETTEAGMVRPETFFDVLPWALIDAPPLPGEEARYAQVLAVLGAVRRDPQLKEAMIEAAADADAQLVGPLFEFRSFGLQLPYHWSTFTNGAAFGTDYFTRTAVAKSTILVNKANETRYFCQDLDADGRRLNGDQRYTVMFRRNATPPVDGFWSLTLYDALHFFAGNRLGRHAIGTRNKDLILDPDGGLTIHVQAEPPSDAPLANWLPAPRAKDFSLYLRAYWAKVAIMDGSWTPPAVCRVS